MSDPRFADLEALHTLDGLEMPRIARTPAEGGEPQLVWRNELDGLTFLRSQWPQKMRQSR